MAIDSKYVRTVLGVQYRWRMIGMIRPRLEASLKQRMTFDSREYNSKYRSIVSLMTFSPYLE